MFVKYRVFMIVLGCFTLSLVIGQLAAGVPRMPPPFMSIRTSLPTPTGGPTYIVTTLEDRRNVANTTSTCSNPCSLREALSIAPDGATIQFDPALSGTLTLSEPLRPYRSVTINGIPFDPKRGYPIIISGGQRDDHIGTQLFDLRSGPAALTLRHLRLIEGLGWTLGGGAIYNQATTLTIEGCSIEQNIAPDKGGGAIYNVNGKLSIVDSTLFANSAGTDNLRLRRIVTDVSYYGGAIYNDRGAITIINSQINANTAFGDGGGVYNIAGTIVISDSVISQNSLNFVSIYRYSAYSPFGNSNNTNTTQYLGGGIYNLEGKVSITRTTFYNNGAFSGGAIYNSSGSLTIGNATFYENNASSGSAIYNVSGTGSVINSTFVSNYASGLLGSTVFSSSGAIRVKNSILASTKRNRDGGPEDAPNCGGVVLSDGNNLQYPGVSCGVFMTSANPKLAPQWFSPSNYMKVVYPLLPDSPAIDMGDNEACQSSMVGGVDQRGSVRPLDGGTGKMICDIGAVEYNRSLVTPTALPSSTPRNP